MDDTDVQIPDEAAVYTIGNGQPDGLRLHDKAGTLNCMHDPQMIMVKEEQKVYGFDSLSSNSMKSKNPYSGCREVDVAKTIDTADPSPNKNQGGMCVVSAGFNGHKSITGSVCYSEERSPCVETKMPPNVVTAAFMAGQGAKAGSLGYAEELSPTLKASPSGLNQSPSIVTPHPRVVEPQIARTLTARHDGSPCVDRGQNFVAIENYPMDSRVTLDESGTCQTLTERMGTGGGNVPMVMAVHQNQQGEVRAGEVAFPSQDINTLNTNSNASGRNAPLIAQSYCIQGNTIDRSDTAGANGKGVNEDVSFTLNTVDRHAVAYDCRSHIVNVELSATLQAKENGGQSLNYINPVAQSPHYIVRKLTPLECGRLQGFPDQWCSDVPHSDSAEYRMWGNGVALPPTLYVMLGVAEALGCAGERER